MTRKPLLALWLAAAVAGCSDGGDSQPAGDASTTYANDAAPVSACPTGGNGTLMLTIDIEDGVAADVRIMQGGMIVMDHVQQSGAFVLDAGKFEVAARRVRKASAVVGPAYQPSVDAPTEVCVKTGTTSNARVQYTREPGSARLWLTQNNGDGAQVMAFDAAQVTALGDQEPSVSLAPALTNVGAIGVDGAGRLWVGSTTGKLVAFAAARLGSSSTSMPDIVLQGSSLCEDSVPCGPRALAFDAQGALWVATLTRITKIAATSLNASGEPPAAVTISSSDLHSPAALAFDADGDLWVGDSEGAILEFKASRLQANVAGAGADTVIFAQQSGPVTSSFGGPEGMVFDADGNLWVGYFAGNDLVRFSKSELASSAPSTNPLTATLHIKVGVEALVTALALDESGNLWLPGGEGSVYRITKDQLSATQPALQRLLSPGIGSVEKLTFDTVPGPLFITP